MKKKPTNNRNSHYGDRTDPETYYTQEQSTEDQYARTYHAKKKKLRLSMGSIFLILVLLGTVGFTYLTSVLATVKGVAIDESDLGITKEQERRISQYDNKIKNILLIGLDEPDEPGDPQRSDSMIIFSLDDKHKNLKLSSLMRDTYVEIPEFGSDKLNHSYAYGGEQLLMKTVNQNFGMDITDYILVNFHDMLSIIDSIGGIEIDVKREEFSYVNEGVRDINEKEGLPIESGYIENFGKQILNGTQATAYARIRRVGNGDYERTDRQRLVLVTIFNKVKNTSLLNMPSMVAQLSRYFKTSLSLTEMIDLGSKILGDKIGDMKQARFPTDWASTEISDDMWYLEYYKEGTVFELYNFIYKNIPPTVDVFEQYLKDTDSDYYDSDGYTISEEAVPLTVSVTSATSAKPPETRQAPADTIPDLILDPVTQPSLETETDRVIETDSDGDTDSNP